MSKAKISDYQGAIKIIQDIRSGVLTAAMMEEIILKIAGLHPQILVKASKSCPELISMSDAAVLIVFTVLDFLKQGQKIEAIKAYRAATGVGLREAKDIIDKLERYDANL